MMVYLFKNLDLEEVEAVFLHLEDAEAMLDSMDDDMDTYEIEEHEVVE